MKSLKPSARENRRYLVLSGKNLKENAEKAVLEFIGILGMAKASLAFIKSEKDKAIISVNREALNEVRASFAVSNYEIKVERVSGTLRGLGR